MARKKAVKRHGLHYAAKHIFSQESLGDRLKTALEKEFTGSASGEGLLIVLLAPVLLLMMIGALFSGEGTTPFPHLPVSEEVEMYSPIIRYYAFEFEIPEFTELIKAVMMQESRGLGSDPMQCSESPYNLKYPNIPGGITDPEYSVEVGIQSLADVLERAGVNDPMDLDGISLALQGYNFGSGYIDWAMENYGGYTEENAAEYAGKMAAQMGWAEYGDPEYVRHVMRYYCFEDG